MNYIPVQLYSLYCVGQNENLEVTPVLMVPALTARRLIKAGFIIETLAADPPSVVVDEDIEDMMMSLPNSYIEPNISHELRCNRIARGRVA